MKIVGVSCSPRRGRTTAEALGACLDAAKAAVPDVETELLELAGLEIRGCLACGRCSKALECSQEDDFTRELLPVLRQEEAAGIVIGTPVYMGSMTSQCKAFLDRTVMLRRNGFLWRGKVGAVLAVGGVRNGGQELAIQGVQAAMLCHDMVLVGDGRPTAHFGAAMWSGAPGGIAGDEAGLETAMNLGRRVAEVARRLAGTKPAAEPPRFSGAET
jgi:multimeric flavodoxin WrbA